MRKTFVFISFLLCSISCFSQQSVARKWNEVLLEAVRHDYARPTVHARNLFHTSAAMYDAWAIHNDPATPYFMGQYVGSHLIPFNEFTSSVPQDSSQEIAISYAAYRILSHRFSISPGLPNTQTRFDTLFVNHLGLDSTFHSTDYSTGNPAALGNYIAEQVIAYGLQDGANEANDYANIYYTKSNTTLLPTNPGTGGVSNWNSWQPLTLDYFEDQSGNHIPINTIPFLSPEWGNVTPFSLDVNDLEILTRKSEDWSVYHNPGAPPQLGIDSAESSAYKWGFELVSLWSSHLDPNDGVMIDISPKAWGNMNTLPENWEDYHSYYDAENGGDTSPGHLINPNTGAAYDEQIVPRGDFARVLAEFWADGPDSETPPGHWFTILNYVSDHPDFEKKYEGTGIIVDNLEWDIKAYFTLGGTMHDAAVTAWSIKGYHDYLRPVTAIRLLDEIGQSTSDTLPNYHPYGMKLIDGFIEQIDSADNASLRGNSYEHVGKTKVYAWKGPDYISDPLTDSAGVDWIRAEEWWPYQRPTFVTPPFAGYVSGHSVFSRAAAEVMTALTGDAFFPGGMGEFHAPKNDFLVFEKGPSVDVTLQWATYQDASDQTSLSRIWGGIHPPVDDIPGRIIGEEVGNEAFAHAKGYFNGTLTSTLLTESLNDPICYPTFIKAGETTQLVVKRVKEGSLHIFDFNGRLISSTKFHNHSVEIGPLDASSYLIRINSIQGQFSERFQVQ